MNRLNKILLLLIVIVFILCAAMFLDLYMEDKAPEQTAPSTEQADPVETTLAVPTETEPVVTVAPETVAPTTEPETEPTTEPTTEPVTEPTTEPTTEPETEPEEDTTDYSIGARIAAVALEQVGKPFVYGTAGPDSYDASGLVQYCYRQVGVNIPRSTASQAEKGKKIAYEDLMPGDAVFIWYNNEGEPEFVGVYVGDGFYVAARSTGKPVSKIDMTTKYYKEHFVFGKRYY